jgi:hypothetical protein
MNHGMINDTFAFLLHIHNIECDFYSRTHMNMRTQGTLWNVTHNYVCNLKIIVATIELIFDI